MIAFLRRISWRWLVLYLSIVVPVGALDGLIFLPRSPTAYFVGLVMICVVGSVAAELIEHRYWRHE